MALLLSGSVSAESIWEVDGNFGFGTTEPKSKVHIIDGRRYSSGEIRIGGIRTVTGLQIGHQDYGSGRSWITSLNNGSAKHNNRISIGFGPIYRGDPKNSVLVIDQWSRVGIGTKFPEQKLHVSNGNISVDHRSQVILNHTAGDNNWISSTGESKAPALAFGTGNKTRLLIAYAGNIGINTETPREALEVNGTILTKDLRFTQSQWADFVFEPDYKLMPLKKVEAFIQKNRHLPDIPSEKEVAQNGVSVKDMQPKLLQKIEELTLHIIALERRIEALEGK